jgi:amidase/aspartyl-tRNA(Asn)/glutamyl-tRNA(Gln) amidotransferase subunit A
MAEAVRSGKISTVELITRTLARIEASDPQINAFTDLTRTRALQRAREIDSGLLKTSSGSTGLPLLGVPFAVKNLFDVQGFVTRAGSKIECDQAPASRDAVLLRRLEAAGAILVGMLNMDEYAYGFTTENSHYGTVHNPHDLTRIAGGSSGGSGAALAAGQVHLTLGSDTNGSIRVPSSLCGVFGLKPTYSRLPRSGSYPFVASLDTLGPMARHVADLALAYDLMQGPDSDDPACAQRAPEPVSGQLKHGIKGLRIGILDGYFVEHAGPQARAAVEQVAQALGITRRVELPLVAEARAAAFLISNSEGAALHLPDLRTRADDFEPLSRDRFLAGTLLPAAWVYQAQRVRHAFARQVAEIFREYDVLLAPATPGPATPIGSEFMEINGRQFATRPNTGLLTQPISCIGLPVCSVPVWSKQENTPLPVGVQLIAAPWREDLVLRVAATLEAAGIVSAPLGLA